MVNGTLVFKIKFCGKSPALRVAANRYRQWLDGRSNDQLSGEFPSSIKLIFWHNIISSLFSLITKSTDNLMIFRIGNKYRSSFKSYR